MKKLIALLLCFATLPTAFANDQVPVKSNIESVTVFFKGAQVFRTGKFSAKSGTTKLIFEDVSPLINPKSIQAKSTGGFDVLDVKHELRYPNPDDLDPQPIPTKIKRGIILLQDSMVFQQFMLDEIAAKLANLTNEKQMLYQNKLASGQGKSDSMALLKEFGAYYREKLEEIESRIASLRWRQHKMSKVKAGMDTRLAGLKNFRKNDRKAQAPLRVKHQIIVTISADQSVSGTIDINYLVANAGWIPAYDLRAFNDNKPMQLDYKASIYQDTGEDWKDVKLTLSTFSFDINSALPSLRPHHVGFLASVVLTSTVAVGTVAPSIGNIDFGVALCNTAPTVNYTMQAVPTFNWDTANGSYNVILTDASEFYSYNYTVNLPELKKRKVETYQPKPVPEYLIAGASFINVEFKIDRKYTIESDGQEQMLSIDDQVVNAKYSHYLVPKSDRNAFLITTINDWEQLNLLKANANIYYDNNYVGETAVNPAIISDTMLLSLGRDRSIFCVRKKTKDEEKSSALSKTKQRIVTIEIIVKNNKNVAVDLHVKDQIPITNEPEIEISLVNASKAELDPETGALTWNVTLKPRQSKTLKFTYSITYDKALKLAI
jgi:hypothetical protein